MSDLLPPNSTPAERALAEAVSRLGDVPVKIREVWDADTIPLPLLPWLAWAYSVDEWDSAWLETQKRDAVKSSLRVQRQKGTIGAVRQALAALGLSIVVQEWFNETPQGEPYTFRVYVETDQSPASQAQLSKALSLISTTKNLRSHLQKVFITAKSRSNVYAVAFSCIGHEITVANYQERAKALIVNEIALNIGA
mgnify:FL=1